MISSGLIAAVVFCWLSFLTVRNYLPCLRELREALARTDSLSNNLTPPARVILCLRGADPFLNRCLRGLATQDYPDYKIIIIVDSLGDAAMTQAEAILQEYGKERIEVHLRDQLWPNCSRKVSSLLCGLKRVSGETEVVALCDGDAIPHSTWLRELVEPLQDPLTVASSGNRWFAPTHLTIGGLCRSCWYALAIPTMYKHRMLWAGSLALRGELFRNSEFLVRLQSAFADDMAISSFAQSQQFRVAPVVPLVILNEETCSLKNFWGFLIRQMLTTRIDHHRWPSIVCEALPIVLLLLVLLPLSIHEGQQSFGWWLAGSVVYDIAALSVMGYFEWMVRQLLLRRREQLMPPFHWGRILMAVPILSLTGIVYSWAIIMTLFAKRHEWRGVLYRINARGVSTLHEREEYGEATAGQYESV